MLGATGGGKKAIQCLDYFEVQDNGGKALLLDPTGEYADLICETWPNSVTMKKTTIQKLGKNISSLAFSDSDIYALLRPSGQTQLPKLSSSIISPK
ncbi:hypothetical protein OH492_18225 [Vibrio chagasii]|nr:hypothetical protein [Vibrio chagasii]